MKKKEVAKLNLSNIVSIDGYESGRDGNLYVSQVDDLTLFKGFKDENKNGVKMLIATARISKASKLNAMYGNFIIVIDKKFNKLPKKQKLALLSIENNKIKNKIDERLKTNYDSNDDSPAGFNGDNELSAMLRTMEEFGYNRTRKAVKKANKFTMRSLKANGKYMYKAAKKANKESDKKVDIETPITLENA